MIRWILAKTGVLAVVIEAVRQDDERRRKAKDWLSSLSDEDKRVLLLLDESRDFRGS